MTWTKPVADHDPRRRDQPGPDEDGEQPGTTALLAWLQAWHIRDETYGAALSWSTRSSDIPSPALGRRHHVIVGRPELPHRQQGREHRPHQLKYGSSPGRTFYTHISDQHAPFHTKVVNVGVRDSTYVLDGLLYHESDLRIEEHYTDTAGFTDHVFALMHLLGFRFARAFVTWATPSSTSRRAMPPTRR
jgi:TnpA family transposase